MFSLKLKYILKVFTIYGIKHFEWKSFKKCSECACFEVHRPSFPVTVNGRYAFILAFWLFFWITINVNILAVIKKKKKITHDANRSKFSITPLFAHKKKKSVFCAWECNSEMFSHLVAYAFVYTRPTERDDGLCSESVARPFMCSQREKKK